MQKGTILITGCSSGIGFASAKVLKSRGWRVLATARSEDDLARLKCDLGVSAIPLELSETLSIAACAERALELADGRIDVLFNNAAYGQLGAVEDLPASVLRQQFEVNVIGGHDLTCRLLPQMRALRAGRIGQCSSLLGLVSAPYRGAYCASKFALEALTDSLRLELRDSGISVSLIEPGPIRTRFLGSALDRFKDTIDWQGSVHRQAYEARLRQLEAGGRQSFKLEPEAVVEKLVHAIESRRPKLRYYVTTPTFAADVMRRVLPTRLLDRFLLFQ